MTAKVLLPSFAAFFLLLMAGFFLLNPSYQKSITAKYYYEVGSYKQAYNLAKEAFSLDVYNRMASTVMAQSKTSLKYIDFIESSKKYMDQINLMAAQEIISDADKARIRLICGIMLDWYIKLAPSVITDDKLIDSAKKYNSMFEKLLEKVDE